MALAIYAITDQLEQAAALLDGSIVEAQDNSPQALAQRQARHLKKAQSALKQGNTQAHKYWMNQHRVATKKLHSSLGVGSKKKQFKSVGDEIKHHLRREVSKHIEKHPVAAAALHLGGKLLGGAAKLGYKGAKAGAKAAAPHVKKAAALGVAKAKAGASALATKAKSAASDFKARRSANKQMGQLNLADKGAADYRKKLASKGTPTSAQLKGDKAAHKQNMVAAKSKDAARQKQASTNAYNAGTHPAQQKTARANAAGPSKVNSAIRSGKETVRYGVQKAALRGRMATHAAGEKIKSAKKGAAGLGAKAVGAVKKAGAAVANKVGAAKSSVSGMIDRAKHDQMINKAKQKEMQLSTAHGRLKDKHDQLKAQHSDLKNQHKDVTKQAQAATKQVDQHKMAADRMRGEIAKHQSMTAIRPSLVQHAKNAFQKSRETIGKLFSPKQNKLKPDAVGNHHVKQRVTHAVGSLQTNHPVLAGKKKKTLPAVAHVVDDQAA
jgi:hypothetical protein